MVDELETLYESSYSRVLVEEVPEDNPKAYLDLDTDKPGLVWYHVEMRVPSDLGLDEHWESYAELCAPMFDAQLRAQVATEALHVADEAERQARRERR